MRVAGQFFFGNRDDADLVVQTGMYTLTSDPYGLLVVFRANRSVFQIKVSNNPKTIQVRSLADTSYPNYMGGWGTWKAI